MTLSIRAQRILIAGIAALVVVLAFYQYPAIEAFVSEFWWVGIGLAFVGALYGAYQLGVQKGSPVYTATLSTEPRIVTGPIQVQTQAEIDTEVSTIINNQAARIMMLEENLASLRTMYEELHVRFARADALRRKWYRLYRKNTGILKAFIASPAMQLPRPWKQYQESLL